MKKFIMLLTFLTFVSNCAFANETPWNNETEFWFQKYKRLRECVEEKITDDAPLEEIEIECLLVEDKAEQP